MTEYKTGVKFECIGCKHENLVMVLRLPLVGHQQYND